MRPSLFKITKTITIKPYERSDEDRFVEMSMDQAVVEYMSGASGVEEEERALFQKIFTIYDRPSRDPIFYIWGIYFKDQLVGHLELKETEHTSDSELEIVFMMHPDARQSGIMKTVLLFFQNNQFFFDRQIIATVHGENKKSLNLLKKWGHSRREFYEEEGVKYVKVWLKRKGGTGMMGWPNYLTV